MSDYGTVLAYAYELENAIPASQMLEFEKIRPAVMGLTKRQRDELAKAEAASAPPAHAAADDKRAKRE